MFLHICPAWMTTATKRRYRARYHEEAKNTAVCFCFFSCICNWSCFARNETMREIQVAVQFILICLFKVLRYALNAFQDIQGGQEDRDSTCWISKVLLLWVTSCILQLKSTTITSSPVIIEKCQRNQVHRSSVGIWGNLMSYGMPRINGRTSVTGVDEEGEYIARGGSRSQYKILTCKNGVSRGISNTQSHKFKILLNDLRYI